MPTRLSEPNFDSLARAYAWLEYLSFGRALERCRFCFLPELHRFRHALALGDGDGRFTAALLAGHPRVSVHAVDSSSQMLQQLSARVEVLGPSARQRLRTTQKSALQFIPQEPFDLVAAHFFFDCFPEEEIAALLRHLQPQLSSHAALLLSEFAIPEPQPLRFAARLLIAVLYRGFAMLTGLRTRKLPDYAPLLRHAGFSLHRQKTYLGGLLVSELWLLRNAGPSPEMPQVSS